MRALVVADIHANLAAFQAVLADAKGLGWVDEVWSLGDVVGYGAQPSECISLLREHRHICVRGNHDMAAAGSLSLEEFNPLAAAAIVWTQSQINPEEKRWLEHQQPVAVASGFTLTHGSLIDPVWDYLVSPDIAEQHLRQQQTAYGFVGHSHQPLVFFEPAERLVPVDDRTSVRLADRRFVANPGGLGQPRDGDPRASYALVDTDRESLDFRRVEYDIVETQAKMEAAGLPPYLIERLSRGR